MNLFNGQTPAQRVATEIFGDQFETMIDMTETSLTTGLTSFSTMPAAGGQLRMSPGVASGLNALINWTSHVICLGIDPTTVVFPIAISANWLCIGKMRELIVKQAKLNAKATKPKTFTTTMNFEE